ncbi:replication initiation protein [Ochrobactrum sp. 695/2009]|uniref:Replication initiation protein RepC n=1 Tax=Brucella intermedia TaxID=94625 RepID=A0A7V6U146_9HYPH|nr:plasmid replication protein RepC [Brucella intermedia]PJR92475.1 replication initiation protein [Ochrobactrum sp. 721/2009]PJT15700.1 replication initiation protein [Ochrobactrum sp. 720/2009]PJT23937.1 replication initiation protein [Ochrobactrum sp. 715/2009]PJT24081.1 replication initiation protein [Ochrobactrum sp. 695/2009]PJT33612.1 replication initiation protein [Ochrobactrum sp. 689/2009]
MQVLQNITSTPGGRMRAFVQNSELKSTEGRGVNRWVIYKKLCVAKSAFHLNDRCLAVLSSLLSFLPEDEMNEKTGLVVFPSNRQLSLRAHGMPESTLRRHLVSLVEAGLIARKDSPTRKRYAHKNKEGQVELAFGFSVAPLLDRATEIAKIADQIIADQQVLKRLRDEVSVLRRDIASTFAKAAVDTGKPCAGLEEVFVRFREVVDAIPRRASLSQLSSIKAELQAIRDDLTISLKSKDISREISGSIAQFERQHNESLPESLILVSQNDRKTDLKACSSRAPVTTKDEEVVPTITVPTVSLDQVLRTCPDIREYGSHGISTWRELFDASRIVSGFLGISNSAFQEAVRFMGAETASTAIAWILQKLNSINSPGGYLRSLTQRARAGSFSIRQLLFSGMNGNANFNHGFGSRSLLGSVEGKSKSAPSPTRKA